MCSRCNSKYQYGESCPKGCFKKAKKEAQAVYDKYQRKNKAFYSSAEWLKIRKVCIARDGMCLWTYYKHNLIANGEVVHHIIEVDEDKEKSLSVDNLIYLSTQAHSHIHKLYKGDKRAIQKELSEMVKKHTDLLG